MKPRHPIWNTARALALALALGGAGCGGLSSTAPPVCESPQAFGLVGVQRCTATCWACDQETASGSRAPLGQGLCVPPAGYQPGLPLCAPSCDACPGAAPACDVGALTVVIDHQCSSTCVVAHTQPSPFRNEPAGSSPLVGCALALDGSDVATVGDCSACPGAAP